MAVETEPHEVAAPDRQLAVEGALLGHVADAMAPPFRGAAVDLDPTRRQRREPEQDAQQRRLPGAVRSEHREELARLDLEVEVLEQRARAEAHRRVAQTDERHAQPPSAASSVPELVLLPRLIARLVVRVGSR